MIRLKHKNSLKKLFYIEIQHDLIKLLIVEGEFAQK